MTETLDGMLYAEMIASGAANLRLHAKEINDLNVFPIPDGDTGDNMLLTMRGGVRQDDHPATLGESAERVAAGMLMAARGNSGVILSQFFEGIRKGFSGLPCADAAGVAAAFGLGVEQAYRSVMSPAEGTMLTVMREGVAYACLRQAETIEDFLLAFLEEAKRSLARTPELLPVLAKAGVVDSGGAGLICIVEGMLRALTGERSDSADFAESWSLRSDEPSFDAFDENSELTFGYCTELLLRLQCAKVDISSFDVKVITDALQTIGDSVVAVKSGSMVKLHVHTAKPQKVLDLCQNYGEFLKVKIENMSLQHNALTEAAKAAEARENAVYGKIASGNRKKIGVVAVACGEGLKEAFRRRGADVTVDGGQSMNPSTADFIEAFDRVNAEIILVFPNNGNVILTAEQAAHLYQKSDVRVMASKNIGEGYAALSMLDLGSDDLESIISELNCAMQGVVTAEISRCVRDAKTDAGEVHVGEYIGFADGRLLAADRSRLAAASRTLECLEVNRYEICILICGKNTPSEEARSLEASIGAKYGTVECHIIDGGQEIYDYILILE